MRKKNSDIDILELVQELEEYLEKTVYTKCYSDGSGCLYVEGKEEPIIDFSDLIDLNGKVVNFTSKPKTKILKLPNKDTNKFVTENDVKVSLLALLTSDGTIDSSSSVWNSNWYKTIVVIRDDYFDKGLGLVLVWTGSVWCAFKAEIKREGDE